jgi:hypothetical protein
MSVSAALRTICLTILAIVPAYLHTAQAAEGKRVALVVGNSAYQHVSTSTRSTRKLSCCRPLASAAYGVAHDA